MTRGPALTRRAFLAATLPWLAACTTPLALDAPRADDAEALARLRRSMAAHGLEAYRALHDISVSYDGQWRPLVNRIQPALVDAGYRGGSQERLLPSLGLVGQRHTGPAGDKQVAWRRGRVEVWRNGKPGLDEDTLDAASLVADAYGLFLLGPLWLADRAAAVRSGERDRVDGRECDAVDVWLKPGLGRSTMDRVVLWIDRDDDLVRRARFTLEGTVATRGAVAEVETFEHVRRHGVVWPTRFYERVVHPIRIPAHDWRLTGLDVNRGFRAEDIDGPQFTGAAAAPATRL